MNNFKVSVEQMISIIVLFMTGSALVVSQITESKQDSWLSFIIGGLFSLPIIFVYARIVRIYPEQNLFDILTIVFGKILGRIIIIVYILYVIHLGALLLNIFTQFIKDVSISETPIIVINLFVILISIMIARSGTEVLGRTAHFVLPFFTFISIMIFLLSIKDMNFGNLLPIMGSGIKEVASSSMKYAAIPFGELIIITMLFSSYKKDKSPYLPFFVAVAVAGLLLVMVIFRETLVLGVGAASMFYYPSYEAVSIISYGDFFTRIEVFLGINLLVCGVIKISVCILSASIGISKLLNLDDTRTTAAPAGLLVLTLSMILFKNTERMLEWADIYPYYAIPFQIVLPLVILVGAEIKSRLAAPPDAKNKAVSGQQQMPQA